jgi:MFS family permease
VRARSLPVLVTPGLSARVWVLQAGVVLNFFGNGLVGPFLVIYLHFFRGIPLAFAGLAIGSGGVFATVSGLLAGTLIDRFGARKCLSAAMTCNALAYAAYTQVHSTETAFLVGSVVGIGTGAYGPCVQTLLSSLVRPEQRAAALSQQRMSAMVGLGLGGLAGGLIAARGRVDDFILLLLLDAGTFLGFAILASRLPNPAAKQESSSGGYSTVFRDRRLTMLAAVNFVIVGAAIAPMLVVLPAFAKGQSHVPVTAIGVIYAFDTAVILLAQLPVTRAVAGREPIRMLSLAAGLWCGSWLFVLATGLWVVGWPAAFVLGAAMLAYALGECLYTAVLTPTAAAIAPSALRGRYLAVIGFAWQAGFMVGPAGGGFLIGRFPIALPVVGASVCIALTVVLSRFRRLLDPDGYRALNATR